jgi:disulfide oxidoreductase YuzD
MKMKKRAGCSSGACQHSVELAQIKQELSDLQATINRRPPVQRVRPSNYIDLSNLSDEDNTDVEPNSP